MTDVVPFKAEHAYGMTVRDVPPEVQRIVTAPAYLEMIERMGPGYTLLIDGKTIGCLVFCKLLYAGVCEVVILGSPDMERYGLTVHRICKGLIDRAQEYHGFRRIEARIMETAKRDRAWAERLGFKPEGVIEAFGPNGENYIQYARIRRV